MPLYSLLLMGVLVLGTPFWVFRMATSGRYRHGLGERLGRVPARLTERVAGRPVLWLHAVSVGEVLAAAEFLRSWMHEHVGWALAISTTTESGQQLARERFPEAAVFYLPLDFATLVGRYLRVLQPQLLVLMESELWPNLIRETSASGAKVAVINARISDRSFPRYMRLRRLWRPILQPVSLFLAQGEETAERLRSIGVSAGRVVVSGNLKYDVRSSADTAMTQQLREAMPEGATVLVAGSTLGGEEAQLLHAWLKVQMAVPGARLILAPRHTQRFEAVATLIAAMGFSTVRASAMKAGTMLREADEVVLLDTIGDLASVYGLASAAFVGGSLVPAGGHNPLEPARFGVPVILGPSFENFREVVRTMQQHEAIRILQADDDLATVLTEALRGDAAMRAMGERGRLAFEAETGATRRTLDALTRLNDEGAGR